MLCIYYSEMCDILHAPCLTLFPHLDTPVTWSFGLQPYGVVMPKAQGYIVSS